MLREMSDVDMDPHGSLEDDGRPTTSRTTNNDEIVSIGLNEPTELLSLPNDAVKSTRDIQNIDDEIKAEVSDNAIETSNESVTHVTSMPSTSAINVNSGEIEIDIQNNLTDQTPLLRPRPVQHQPTLSSKSCSALMATLLNFAMIVVGALNIDKCEILKLLPMYLIVAGAVGLVLKPFFILCQRCSKNAVNCFMCIISLLELAWMIFLSYLVYSAKPDFDPANPSYCNKVAYYFAFWLLTIYWTVLGLGIAFLCCSCCFYFGLRLIMDSRS